MSHIAGPFVVFVSATRAFTEFIFPLATAKTSSPVELAIENSVWSMVAKPAVGGSRRRKNSDADHVPSTDAWPHRSGDVGLPIITSSELLPSVGGMMFGPTCPAHTVPRIMDPLNVAVLP